MNVLIPILFMTFTLTSYAGPSSAPKTASKTSTGTAAPASGTATSDAKAAPTSDAKAAPTSAPLSSSSEIHTFYDLAAQDIRGKKIHFSQYRGKVVLVVNTASKCGFTPQLKGLEALYKQYGPKGFIVLAFPSNDFRQEASSNEELAKFAKDEYGTSFPFFERAPVSGSQKQPVYIFLVQQKSGLLFREVSWNFEKFLIDRKGNVIERWNWMTSPSSDSVTGKIEEALNEPI